MIRFTNASSQYLGSVSQITPPSNGTLSLWVTEATFINNSNLFRCTGANFELKFITGVILRGRVNIGTNINTTTTFTVGVRYNVLTTWSAGATQTTVNIYINGVLDGGSPVTANTSNPGAGTFSIGSTGASQYLDGTLEDFRLYNRVLNLDEIQTIYACNGNDGIVYGLLHRWCMNEKNPTTTATGTGTVVDWGPSQINMTPVNSPTYQENIMVLSRRSAS